MFKHPVNLSNFVVVVATLAILILTFLIMEWMGEIAYNAYHDQNEIGYLVDGPRDEHRHKYLYICAKDYLL